MDKLLQLQIYFLSVYAKSGYMYVKIIANGVALMVKI